MKECRSCGTQKPLREFYKRSDSGKYHNSCTSCWYDKQLLRKYGITLEEYDRLYEKQSGVCAICHLPQSSTRNSRLCVDHDHQTGEVRGLLCSDCNRGIGLLKDDYRILNNAADYLRAFAD